MKKMVEEMNKRAEAGTLLGHIDPPYDGKTHLSNVSHRVLPGAVLNKDGSISVDIEILDTQMGRHLRAMMEHSGHRLTVSSRGKLSGFGVPPDHIKINSVDFDLSIPQDWTVLDGICDALDKEED
jgi:hypothetical protein